MAWYEVYIDNGNGLDRIYLAGDADLVLENLHYKPSMGSAGTLEFNIAQNHPFYNAIRPMLTDFWLYRDGEPVFRGRYVGSKIDFERTGSLIIEGDLNFLLDSVQDPYDYTGTVQDFFARIIQNHNAMVEDRKRFTVGLCNVGDRGNEIAKKVSDYTTSMDALNSLVKEHGGYLHTRHEDGTTYLDYTTDYGGSNNQPIRFGENLIDINKNVDASTVITCLIPLGAEVETTSADGMTEKKRITIESVNNNVNYITSPQGISQYGQIWGAKVFDDITLPAVLLSAARQYLNEAVALPQSITLGTVDLSLIDANYEQFRIGYWTTVESEPHNISEQYLLKEADIDITEPENTTITLGGKVTTLTSTTAKSVADVSRAVTDLAASTSIEINDKVNNATQLITGGLGGYVVIGRNGADGHPDEILIMDAPKKENARNIIRLNKNGIGFSNSGYNGTYRNAWTIDGNLVADFITSGTMSADRIRGGTMELGGSGFAADGSIVIRNAAGQEIGRWNRNGIYISHGAINIGQFSADDYEVHLGCFKAYESDVSGAEYLATDSESVGMGNHPDFAFWAGSSGNNPPFAVKQNGQVYVKELFPQGSWWNGWSLTRTIQTMWEAMEDAGLL